MFRVQACDFSHCSFGVLHVGIILQRLVCVFLFSIGLEHDHVQVVRIYKLELCMLTAELVFSACMVRHATTCGMAHEEERHAVLLGWLVAMFESSLYCYLYYRV
jgi:hypothetical protein